MKFTPNRRPALVCFTANTDIWWLRILKPNFRHCFALIDMDDCWLLYNPLSNRTDIGLFPAMPIGHLRRHLEETGHFVVETVSLTDTPRKLAPVFPYSCVEAVKRLIGRQFPLTKTPYQLQKQLKEHLLNKNLDFQLPVWLYKSNQT